MRCSECRQARSRIHRSGRSLVLKSMTLAGAFILGAPSLGSAATFLAFGPQTYVRHTGPPETVRNTFSVLNPSTQYSLRIHVNGVSSAVVSVNGVEVAGPSDFNEQVTLIEKRIVLRANNELAVEV